MVLCIIVCQKRCTFYDSLIFYFEVYRSKQLHLGTLEFLYCIVQLKEFCLLLMEINKNIKMKSTQFKIFIYKFNPKLQSKFKVNIRLSMYTH